MRLITKGTASIIGLAALFTAAQASETVYSNSGGSGDTFTNPGSSAAGAPIVNYTGPNNEQWMYRNTANNGTVGINTNYARSGDGSAYIASDGTASGKSEIALSTSFSGQDSTGSLGLLDNLSAWSADTYTQSCSILGEAPILRMELFSATDTKVNGSLGVYGQLVFDTGWGTDGGLGSQYAYGNWQNIDLFGNKNTIHVWGSSSLGTKYGPGIGVERNLSDWLTDLAGKGYSVIGINAGMGSSSLTYQGAVDNYALGFGGRTNTYNFEAVPEPATMAMLGMGALAFLRKRRRS